MQADQHSISLMMLKYLLQAKDDTSLPHFFLGVLQWEPSAMAAHLSAHVVLWTVGALACLTVIMYNPLVAHLWPILTGTRTLYIIERP